MLRVFDPGNIDYDFAGTDVGIVELPFYYLSSLLILESDEGQSPALAFTVLDYFAVRDGVDFAEVFDDLLFGEDLGIA